MSLFRFFLVSPPLYAPFVSVCVCERSRTKSNFNCFFSIAPLFARVIIPDYAGGGTCCLTGNWMKKNKEKHVWLQDQGLVFLWSQAD